MPLLLPASQLPEFAAPQFSLEPIEPAARPTSPSALLAVPAVGPETTASPTVEAVNASPPAEETTDPAPAETVEPGSQPQRPCRSVQALATRAPRRLCTTPQPSCSRAGDGAPPQQAAIGTICRCGGQDTKTESC